MGIKWASTFPAALDYQGLYGNESLALRQNKRATHTGGSFVLQLKTARDLNKGETNRRRGNERSEAIARQCGTKSLAARQNNGYNICCSRCFFISKGFEQGGRKRSFRKKTVRWTVFADAATSGARR